MDYVGTIELKPGVDPTPRHITDLIAEMKPNTFQLSFANRNSPKKFRRSSRNKPVRHW